MYASSSLALIVIEILPVSLVPYQDLRSSLEMKEAKTLLLYSSLVTGAP